MVYEFKDKRLEASIDKTQAELRARYKNLDYRDLLKKYVRTIGNAEGYLYLDYGDFTAEEEAEINALSKEAYEEELEELEQRKLGENQ